MGKSLGGSSGKSKPATPYKEAQFKPYTYTNAAGTTASTLGSDGSYNVTSNIDPRLDRIGSSGLDYSDQFLNSFMGQAARDIPQFSWRDDVDGTSRRLFEEQSQLLKPAFEKQRQELQSDLFGSGRLGLKLASDAAGSVGGGMVNPDAYGLGRAQSQALGEVAMDSRRAAVNEEQDRFNRLMESYNANQNAQQAQMKNYLTGYTGGMGAFENVLGFEDELVNRGLTIEDLRANAQASSANAGSSLAQAGTRTGGSKGLLGSAMSSFGGAMDFSGAGGEGNKKADGGSKDTGDYAMDALKIYLMSGSDRKLKKNIRKVDQLPSGLNLYLWDWTEEAKKLLGDQPTYGVIAQEAMEIFPQAVCMHPDGYLAVDYARIS